MKFSWNELQLDVDITVGKSTKPPAEGSATAKSVRLKCRFQVVAPVLVSITRLSPAIGVMKSCEVSTQAIRPGSTDSPSTSAIVEMVLPSVVEWTVMSPSPARATCCPVGESATAFDSPEAIVVRTRNESPSTIETSSLVANAATRESAEVAARVAPSRKNVGYNVRTTDGCVRSTVSSAPSDDADGCSLFPSTANSEARSTRELASAVAVDGKSASWA